jgi:phenylacetyl-CoA:acceptor oxidoreductase subunit 2
MSSAFGPNAWVQQHWDWRAAANFMLGGAGAGLLFALSFIPDGARYPMMLALALVAAGLGAVWLEIGRKLRAVHVMFNPFTSWMTRESFVAVILFGAGISFLFLRQPWAQYAAALAGLAFLFCQAMILRASKGIPAWRMPEAVPLILCTGLAEGAGVLLAFDARPAVLALLGLAVIARALAWTRYRGALRQPGARASLEPAGTLLLWLGSAAPLALLLASLAVPQAAALAGLAALAAGWRLKFVLVARASFNQGFALPKLPVRGAR